MGLRGGDEMVAGSIFWVDEGGGVSNGRGVVLGWFLKW